MRLVPSLLGKIRIIPYYNSIGLTSECRDIHYFVENNKNMEERFILRKCDDVPDWWVLHDKDNGIVIRFKEHEFNETQEVKLTTPNTDAQQLATAVREIGDWLFSHAYSVAMPTPTFEFREWKDKTLILRNKHPRLTINIEDECDAKQLADALRSASEFVRKGGQIK